ncbi:hypothetical protein JCM6882_007651 [Rhodosporidiobolus microsporus]
MGHPGLSPSSIPSDWLPPTPRSNLVPLPTPTLPVDHLVLLPPPLLPHDSQRADNDTFVRPPPPAHRPSLPSLAPLLNPSPPADDHALMNDSLFRTSQEQQDAEFAASLAEESSSARPRRFAAIVAARNIPRQPSPFDLEDDGGDPYAAEDDDDALSMSPPPPGAGGSGSRKRASTGSAAGGGGGGGGAAGASKRKVSHSLIERRRREKINVCLQTLKETVPSLKEEGEKKMAKARERGRKRGRGDDAGERGGLHKLEILQGTILYIEELRARIAELEEQQAGSNSSAPSTTSSSSTSRTAAVPSSIIPSGVPAAAPSPSPPSLSLIKHAPPPLSGPYDSPPLTLPSPLLRASISSALAMTTSFPPLTASAPAVAPLAPSDHEAGMLLLNFSTSPELRPVQM